MKDELAGASVKYHKVLLANCNSPPAKRRKVKKKMLGKKVAAAKVGKNLPIYTKSKVKSDTSMEEGASSSNKLPAHNNGPQF